MVVLALCFTRNDEFPVKHTRELLMNGCVRLAWVYKMIRAAHIQSMKITHYEASMVRLIDAVSRQIKDKLRYVLGFWDYRIPNNAEVWVYEKPTRI